MSPKGEDVHLTCSTLCRSSSVINMVKSWHQEKQHYSFPHPRECNPRCPSKCSSSVCSHYTQVSVTHSPGAVSRAGVWDGILAAGLAAGTVPAGWVQE